METPGGPVVQAGGLAQETTIGLSASEQALAGPGELKASRLSKMAVRLHRDSPNESGMRLYITLLWELH